MNMDFQEWLMDKQRDKGLNNSQLAKLAGVSHTTIGDIINGRRPSAELCISLGKALGTSPEDVLRIAGYLPKIADEMTVRQIFDAVKNLDAEEQKNLLEYVLWRIQQQRKKNKGGGFLGL